jgi:hypothetical protein
MKLTSPIAIGGKAFPFALSLLTANLLVANMTTIISKKSLLRVHTLRALALTRRHLLMYLIVITFRSRALSPLVN